MSSPSRENSSAPDQREASHTATEIAQQPRLWRQVAADPATAGARTFLHPLLQRPDLRVVVTGAGTSSFTGQVLAPELTRQHRRRVDAVPTTDIVSNPRGCFAEDVPTLLVSFARSGDSPESLASTKLADRCLTEAHHLVVTCNPDGELARHHRRAERSHLLLMPNESNDKGFAMTSSFTCMTLAALLALGHEPQPDLGERLAGIAERVLADYDMAARELSNRGYNRIVYLGSGPLKGLARESGLKILELTAGELVGSGDSPLAFRHGPKAILDSHTLVVVYLSNNPYTRAYDLDLLAELRQAQGIDNVVAVTAEHHDLPDDTATWILPAATDLPDAAFALPAVLCAQLIGLHASITLGRTVDNPFPSGGVNRVVQGVTVHPLCD